MLRISISKTVSLTTSRYFSTSTVFNNGDHHHDEEYKSLLKYAYLTKKAQQVFENDGYHVLPSNTLVHEGLYEELRSESFAKGRIFDSRPLTGGGFELSMRPEGTIRIVRRSVEKAVAKTELPKKFYYNEALYTIRSLGILKKFNKIGVENIGVGDALASVELISTANKFMQVVKKKDSYQIEISPLPHINSGGQYYKALAECFNSAINYSKLEPATQNRLKKYSELTNWDIEHALAAGVTEWPKAGDYLVGNSKKYYDQVKEGLIKRGIEFKENANLLRGLDYYTNLYFEIKDKKAERDENKRVLLTGGKYELSTGQTNGSGETPALEFGADSGVLIGAFEESDEYREFVKANPDLFKSE